MVVLALLGASLSACERPVQGNAAAPAQAKPVAVAASPPPVAEARRPAPEIVSDAFISGAVRAALMGDPTLQGSDVSVNTSRGVVSLTGHVKTREQAAVAAAHAEGEDGVMRVDNTLVVLND